MKVDCDCLRIRGRCADDCRSNYRDKRAIMEQEDAKITLEEIVSISQQRGIVPVQPTGC